MPAFNKAHTATANRVAQRYGGIFNPGDGVDIETDDLAIEVETSATVQDGVRRLNKRDGRVYVAVTNKEGLPIALDAAEDSRVGVMDPHGNIVRECGML